jgi:hypothetical protein
MVAYYEISIDASKFHKGKVRAVSILWSKEGLGCFRNWVPFTNENNQYANYSSISILSNKNKK